MQPTGTFSDQPFRSYSSLKMSCLKMKSKNRSVFCVLEFAMFDISLSLVAADYGFYLPSEIHVCSFVCWQRRSDGRKLQFLSRAQSN
jgi:hypothetical protein